jgi:ubiquinone/menaquinone biosynthesis C-methylase UbiE
MKREHTADFDQIARVYRWMEYIAFGRALERCRNHFLPQLRGCRGALVLGDGDGRFLAALLAANSELHADAVDISAAMLRLLRRRTHTQAPKAAEHLRVHNVNALRFTPDGAYDLIVTHFFLDCLTQSELEILVRRVAPHLLPGALWVVSDFRIPAGAMHWPARVLVRGLYLAFRILTGLRATALPDHAAVLTSADFVRVAEHCSRGSMLFTELWEYTPAMLPPQRPKAVSPPDPLPDPEPASPSLAEPDPGVFHHDPAPLASSKTGRPCPPEE